MEADLYIKNGSGTPIVFVPVDTAHPVPVEVVSGSGAVSDNIVATATFTRPSNTTPYSANTAVGTADTPILPIQFTLAGVNGGGGVILNATMSKSTTSLTNATFRLHLFDSAAPTLTAINDGSSYPSPVIADYPQYLGYFDFVSGIAGAAGVATYQGAPSQSLLSFVCAAASKVVYGVLEVTGAYTPGSGEVFDFRLVAQAA